nr:PREDICTED: extracellular calcium-sensing receptor-like isoform X2 [Latimeria chalumnae]|eukprot:XP_006012814.1 PREDICTED: extracellular calcium-sensing receptor-like isoform X2 [Latimeria chalumnae]
MEPEKGFREESNCSNWDKWLLETCRREREDTGWVGLVHANRVENLWLCSFSFEAYQWVQTTIFTIDEINQNPTLLPNITLGFKIYDTCYLVTRALEGSFWMMTGQDEPIPNYRCNSRTPLAAVIGESQSRVSIPVARLLGIYEYPQISYFSTAPSLSDRTQFPSFFRTIPSDNFQSYGLVRLLLYFGWTWVGLLAGEDEYGVQGSQIVKEEMEKAGVCLAFSETIPLHYSKEKAQRIIDIIKKSSANAIIVFSPEIKWNPVAREVARQNVTGKVWIATESWATASNIFTKENFKILRGTIGFAVRSGKIPGLKEFLHSIHPSKSPDDIFIREFWEEAFVCKWPNPDSNETKPSTKAVKEPSLCTGTERLEDLSSDYSDASNLRGSYNVYNAVYAIAHALHELYSCKPGEGPFSSGTCANILDFTPRQVPQSACSESCSPGYRKATREGEPICCFDCIRCSEGEITNHTDSVECVKCPDDHWSNEAQDRCIPKSIDFLSYEDPMGATLAAISLFAALITAATLCTFIKYQDTPIVKANNRELSYLLLLALMLCFLCSLIFIGYPMRVTCMLRQVAFGIIFTLSVSCVLAKTFMVIIAFNATNPNSNLRKWIGPKLPIAIVCVGTLLQVIICIVWLSSSPPFPEQNIKSQVAKIIIECNEGSVIAFWCMLGYMGLLAIISFIVAFLARRLPGSFNEAQFITFSMLVFVTVWLGFIPAYLSTRGKYMAAVEIFAILASSAGLLACIFFPKCYIIILKPDMNTKEYLMGKESSSNKKLK